MNVPGITEAAIEAAYAAYKSDAEKNGYRLNPDEEFVKNLIRGLLKNEQRYGYRACPCRLAYGIKEQDSRCGLSPAITGIVDLEEHGACYCALYVNEAIASVSRRSHRSPKRRPPRSEAYEGRSGQGRFNDRAPGLSPAGLALQGLRVSLRTEQPPGICPICKATKERFERFV